MTRQQTTDEQVWARIDTTAGPDACHPWRGGKRNGGYGTFQQAGRRWQAHMWVMIKAGVDIPDGMIVCHTCDNPSCCNRRHLYVGTHSTNAQDRESRGRGRGWAEVCRALTHCKSGHPFDETNTYIRIDRKGRSARGCRACNLAAVERYKARKRVAA